MNNPSSMQMVSVRDFFRSIGYTGSPGQVRLNELIKRYNVIVTGEMKAGGGSLRMMSAEQAAKLLAEHKAKKEALRKPVVTEAVADQAFVHIGALEAKIDRMEQVINANTEAISLLIKQLNFVVEQQTKILKELGSTAAA